MKRSKCILYHAGIPHDVLSAEGLPTDISDFGFELHEDADSLIIYSVNNSRLHLATVVIKTQNGIFTDIDGVHPAFPDGMTVYGIYPYISYSGVIFAKDEEAYGNRYRVNHTDFKFKNGFLGSAATHIDDEYPPLV